MSHDVNPGGIRFFESAMNKHGAVTECVEVSSQFYRIERKKGGTLYVYLTGMYVVGSMDYYEIHRDYPLLTTIVLAGQWQNIAPDAKDEAAKRQVGVFKVKGFMGCLNRRDHWKFDGPSTID
ncbi:hypothetical protein PX52LOC_00719 [Limnoglobus roseus]|uniref:Uncharacterized protein n=1 Tax=Limnoglobus roseus TaxID=2598579 RepID=A0A5C1A444_9BACT|nr:hypothetical protein PX52LOC_00719 [Limnoglobus roseus]